MTDYSTLDYAQQLSLKTQRTEALLAPYFEKPIQVFSSTEQHYRMRAEFRIWHEGDDSYHIMFDQTNKQQYRVDQLPAASTLINKGMQVLQSSLIGNQVLRKKLFQVDYLSTLSGELLISMLYHRQLDDEWIAQAQSLKQQFADIAQVDIIGRARKQKVVVDRDFVIETLPINQQNYTFKQVENSFTQPNALVNCKMIEWAIQHCQSAQGDLLELYCGAGNFSVPLAKVFKHVVGTEISKTSVNAAQFNIRENNIDNLTIVRLSSEEFVQAMNKEREFTRLAGIDLDAYQFSSVLVDPPRAGLDTETVKLISQFERIIYISCNPDTLADNLVALSTTHEIEHAAIFDQFPFTHHIESGVILTKKSA